MFICRNCKHCDRFELMFSPNYSGKKVFDVKFNESGDLEITVDGYTFTPDLQFMNECAVCSYCGSVHRWDYN